jgi:opacity protein-like surface antigen
VENAKGVSHSFHATTATKMSDQVQCFTDNDQASHRAELEGDARVHALLIDGKYNFDNSLGSGLPLHPYLSSGIGFAMYDMSSSTLATNLASQSNSTVPLFRAGAGVAYQLGDKWDMSLDYKAGFSGGSDQLYLGHAQSTDMQSVNIGMHFSF